VFGSLLSPVNCQELVIKHPAKRILLSRRQHCTYTTAGHSCYCIYPRVHTLLQHYPDSTLTTTIYGIYYINEHNFLKVSYTERKRGKRGRGRRDGCMLFIVLSLGRICSTLMTVLFSVGEGRQYLANVTKSVTGYAIFLPLYPASGICYCVSVLRIWIRDLVPF
jgi:hypothetical protein